MLLEICGSFMILSIAKEIWDAIKQTYSKMKDDALIYEVMTELTTIKQDDLSIIEYFNVLKVYWLERLLSRSQDVML